MIIIGIALLAIILSYLLFCYTGTILPLFITIVVAYLFYRRIDRYFDQSEQSLH